MSGAGDGGYGSRGGAARQRRRERFGQRGSPGRGLTPSSSRGVRARDAAEVFDVRVGEARAGDVRVGGNLRRGDARRGRAEPDALALNGGRPRAGWVGGFRRVEVDHDAHGVGAAAQARRYLAALRHGAHQRGDHDVVVVRVLAGAPRHGGGAGTRGVVFACDLRINNSFWFPLAQADADSLGHLAREASQDLFRDFIVVAHRRRRLRDPRRPASCVRGDPARAPLASPKFSVPSVPSEEKGDVFSNGYEVPHGAADTAHRAARCPPRRDGSSSPTRRVEAGRRALG